MKFSWLFFSFFILVTLFTSCEKEIKIPLSAGDPKLVVEGSIATDQQPIVILTKSVGFFDKIDFSSIEFIPDAEVYVTDLTADKRIRLKPISVQQFTVYTIDNTDPLFNHFEKGLTEHIYQLEIKYNNEFYSAVAKIPNTIGFDSLYFEANGRFNDTLFSLKATYSDPDTVGNYYKYFTKRTGNGYADKDYLEPFSSRIDDAFINGQKKLPYELFIAFEKSDSVDNEFTETASYSKIGDTISVRLSAMDRSVYEFWKTLDFAKGSIGNPFASPIQVQSNLTNDAFGVWSAFGNTYKTIINKP